MPDEFPFLRRVHASLSSHNFTRSCLSKSFLHMTVSSYKNRYPRSQKILYIMHVGEPTLVTTLQLVNFPVYGVGVWGVNDIIESLGVGL